MATHSSTLAWKIPWTEEPGGFLSMGSQSWTRLKQLSSSSSNSNTNIWCSLSISHVLGQAHLLHLACEDGFYDHPHFIDDENKDQRGK